MGGRGSGFHRVRGSVDVALRAPLGSAVHMSCKQAAFGKRLECSLPSKFPFRFCQIPPPVCPTHNPPVSSPRPFPSPSIKKNSRDHASAAGALFRLPPPSSNALPRNALRPRPSAPARVLLPRRHLGGCGASHLPAPSFFPHPCLPSILCPWSPPPTPNPHDIPCLSP
jgi:hypothetical protein